MWRAITFIALGAAVLVIGGLSLIMIHEERELRDYCFPDDTAWSDEPRGCE